MHTKQERNLIRDTIKQCIAANKTDAETVEALQASGTKTANGLNWSVKNLTNFKYRNPRLLGIKTTRKKKRAYSKTAKVPVTKPKTITVKPITRETDTMALIELVMAANIDQNKKIQIIGSLVK